MLKDMELKILDKEKECTQIKNMEIKDLKNEHNINFKDLENVFKNELKICQNNYESKISNLVTQFTDKINKLNNVIDDKNTKINSLKNSNKNSILMKDILIEQLNEKLGIQENTIIKINNELNIKHKELLTTIQN